MTKVVKFKRELTPPGGGEPTQHVHPDWVIRHEEHYELHIGDMEWNVGANSVQGLRDTGNPPSPTKPNEDRREGGWSATHVVCPMCANHFGVSPDFDTGKLTCYRCNTDFYGQPHTA